MNYFEHDLKAISENVKNVKCSETCPFGSLINADIEKNNKKFDEYREALGHDYFVGEILNLVNIDGSTGSTFIPHFIAAHRKPELGEKFLVIRPDYEPCEHTAFRGAATWDDKLEETYNTDVEEHSEEEAREHCALWIVEPLSL